MSVANRTSTHFKAELAAGPYLVVKFEAKKTFDSVERISLSSESAKTAIHMHLVPILYVMKNVQRPTRPIYFGELTTKTFPAGELLNARNL